MYSMKLIFLSLSVAVLAGCGTAAIVQADFAGPASDESLVVLGARPDVVRLHFQPVTLAGQGARADGFPAINGIVQDGYLIGTAKAGQYLALMSVYTKNGSYHACGGRRALVFEVPKGQVVYIADAEYDEQGKTMQIRYHNRLKEAQEHVRVRFPRLKQEVQLLVPRSLPLLQGCPSGVMFLSL